jgi:hypothetical protein
LGVAAYFGCLARRSACFTRSSRFLATIFPCSRRIRVMRRSSSAHGSSLRLSQYFAEIGFRALHDHHDLLGGADQGCRHRNKARTGVRQLARNAVHWNSPRSRLCASLGRTPSETNATACSEACRVSFPWQYTSAEEGVLLGPATFQNGRQGPFSFRLATDRMLNLAQVGPLHRCEARQCFNPSDC